MGCVVVGRGFVLVAAGLLLDAPGPPPVQAIATLTVNTAIDTDQRDDFLSLREALLLTAFATDRGVDGGVGMDCLTVGEAALLSGVNLVAAPVVMPPAPFPCFYDPVVETRYRIDPANPGVGVGVANRIVFTQEVGVIFVAGSALPPLKAGSSIDGTRAADRVVLAGDLIASGSGLTLDSCCNAQNAVRNLIIRNFPAHGIEASSQSDSSFQGLVIFGNQGDGMRFNAATNVRIGGPADADRNVVHRNGGNGITILGAGAADVELNNRIENNCVGLRSDGQLPDGNGGDGIALLDAGANLIIGNTVSANRGSGIHISGPAAHANQVLANAIGTDSTATAARGNARNGVQIDGGAQRNAIGVPGAGNIVSGNGAHGIALLGTGTTDNRIDRNSIGTDGRGMFAIANGENGVAVAEGAAANLISANLISGNLQNGILLRGATTANNTVSGNRIGTNGGRTGSIGNARHGLLIDGGARFNVVSSATVAYNGGAGAAVLPGSFGNTLNFIAIYANGGLGIDLDDDGVGCATGDSGGDRCNAPPTIARATSREASGTAAAAARVAIYIPDDDASGYGEGSQLLTTVTADRSGAWTAHFTPSLCPTDGAQLRITATSTVAGAGTSEFAPNTALTCVPDATATPTTARSPSPAGVGTSTPTGTPPAATATRPPTCWGDCDGNRAVSVAELLTMVNIDLGQRPVADCAPGDRDGSGQIAVDEILTAVINALHGCA